MSFQGFEVAVEVTVKDGDSSKQRGDLLEDLAKRVLIALRYSHVSTEVRVTGCELDIVATDSQSAERILVECKAYRDKSIPADVLTKMLGNVSLHDFESSWLICTSKLGKDATGVLDKLRKTPGKSSLLRVYDPDELVHLLVSTGRVCSPELLALPSTIRPHSARTLLITDIGEFWAVPIIGEKSGIADTVLTFDARNGIAITNDAIVQQLGERDSNLRELSWVSSHGALAAVTALKDATLRVELDNIAPVPVADDWSDYRPSRPQDFVGRHELLQSIIGFFDAAAEGRTDTRLLAIKAPSGWGKSSFLVKLRSMCALPKYRSKIFLYAVDCRTASSSRYPELALKKCFEEAVDESFIGSAERISIASAGQPFSDPGAQSALDNLKAQKKVIVLFFDQFEEITTKQELADLFAQVKAMCSAVESAGENVILGFSWKTDGTIPTDHPAYHVWHSFADRRREFELPLFSKQDTSQLLSGLSSELKQPIEVWLRRLLAEHSQGYPWLLKKLCVHVFRVLQAQPARQRELFERALDVEALFQRDLADLDPIQYACLERIARESPAENFQITEQFGNDAVSALMHRRLVLRNAGKLIVYWDIFRDYVLFKQVPAIPTRYIPVSSPISSRTFIDNLSATANTHLVTLTKRTGWKQGTLDNIARDLVMMGVCRYDRKNSKVKLVHAEQKKLLAAIFKFFNTHAFLRVLTEEFAAGFRSVAMPSIEAALLPRFDSISYEKNTIHVSIRRWIGWLTALGILSIDVEGAVTHNLKAAPLSTFDDLRIEQRAHRGRFIFKGESSPSKVSALLDSICIGGYEASAEDRNALMVLRSLRLIPSTALPVLSEAPPSRRRDLWLAVKVDAQPSVRAARAILERNPTASTTEVGEVMSTLSSNQLSEASKRRYGAGLMLWIPWIDALFEKARGGEAASTAP